MVREEEEKKQNTHFYFFFGAHPTHTLPTLPKPKKSYVQLTHTHTVHHKKKKNKRPRYECVFAKAHGKRKQQKKRRGRITCGERGGRPEGHWFQTDTLKKTRFFFVCVGLHTFCLQLLPALFFLFFPPVSYLSLGLLGRGRGGRGKGRRAPGAKGKPGRGGRKRKSKVQEGESIFFPQLYQTYVKKKKIINQ